MAFTFIDNNDGTYDVGGHTTGFWFGWIFGVLLLIVGFIGMFVNPIGAAIILFIANIILFINGRHQKTLKQRLINEYAAKKDKVEEKTETYDQRDQKIAKLQKELDELKKQ